MPPRTRVKSVTITPTAGMVVKVRRTDRSGPAKLFVNIAYDSHIPRPPSASPETVKAALNGEIEREYAVPLIVSDLKASHDKAGADSIVVDVILSPVVEDGMKDADFRRFIIELALQKVEQRHAMTLDRTTLAFPNIRSKGPLESRSVMLPSNDADNDDQVGRPLVEEVTPQPTVSSDIATRTSKITAPKWRWTQDADNGAVRIIVDVPHLSRAIHASATLDLEPGRLILQVADVYALDVSLDRLPRPVDVDRARAEWRVGSGQLVISC